MERILFITTRNIISTCGELRLVKNRSIVLKEEYGISTDFIAYRIRKKEHNEDIGGRLKILRNPKDWKELVHLTRKLVASDVYNCVIISGGPLFLIPIIRQVDSQCKIIVDIHGTIEEYVEFRNKSLIEKIIFRALYKLSKHNEKKYIPRANGVFVVSYPLAEYYQSLVRSEYFKTFIVPCAIATNITYDDYCRNRKKYRKKYELMDSDKVFVYSGGASPWQCLDETVDLFERLREKLGDSCVLLIFSNNNALIEKCKGRTGIITDSLSPDAVSEVLCVGDFGIMLRKDYMTNNVAFPNKFLEYIGSGLRVVASPYVYDVRYYIEQYDMGMIIDVPVSESDVERLRAAAVDNYDIGKHFLRRNLLIEKLSFKETLKPFVDYIGVCNE